MRVGENGLPELWRQITRGQQVDGNAKQVLQLGLKGAKIEQGGSRQGVDENIEIASFLIVSARRRAEDPRIR